MGVDLGTSYTVLVVLDAHNTPIAGEYRFTQIVRDGLVVDYIGAVSILREMKHNLESRLGRTLTHSASGYPPGVPQAEVQSTANVVEAAGMICSSLVDEARCQQRAWLKDGVSSILARNHRNGARGSGGPHSRAATGTICLQIGAQISARRRGPENRPDSTIPPVPNRPPGDGEDGDDY